MKRDESRVSGSPRPTPVSCSIDLAIPACALFGARVRSVNCARVVPAPATRRNNAQRRLGLERKPGLFGEVDLVAPCQLNLEVFGNVSVDSGFFSVVLMALRAVAQSEVLPTS